MRAVTVAGLPVWYYAAGEEIPAEVTAEVFRYRFAHEALTMDHPRMRRVIIPKGTNGLRATLLGALHWDDGRDLGALDDRLAAGQDVGEDAGEALDAALLTEVHSAVCPNCASAFMLARPIADYPAGKTAGREHGEPSYTCPNCGHVPFPPFVEVLER